MIDPIVAHVLLATNVRTPRQRLTPKGLSVLTDAIQFDLGNRQRFSLMRTQTFINNLSKGDDTMPRSKNWKTYSEAFHEMLQVGVTRVLVIPCPSEKAAYSLRGSIYAFFGALQSALKDRTTEPEDRELVRTLRNMSTKVKLSIQDNQLIVTPADEAPKAKLLRNALGEQTGPATGAGPSEGLLERLKGSITRE